MKKIIVISSLILSFSVHAFGKVEKKSHQNKSSKQSQETIDPSQVSLPKDQEVCFSPEEPCDLKLLKFIESAEKSIDVAVFDINLDQIVHALLVKSKSIPVRVLVDKRQSKGPHSLVKTLVKGGVQVRYGSQRGVMHHKFVIVDQKSLQTGSFNYTNHAYKANQENQIYLFNALIVDRYLKRFEQSWSKGKEVILEALVREA